MRGILINGSLHTGDDLGMLYKGKTDVNPEPKLMTVEIPGLDGTIDYSNIFGGVIHFNNRPVTFHLFYAGTHDKTLEVSRRLSAFHGQNVEVSEPDAPDWHYSGRASVEISEQGANYVYIDFSLNAYPYILKNSVTQINTAVNGSVVLTAFNSPMPTLLKVRIKSFVSAAPPDEFIRGFKLTYCGNFKNISFYNYNEIVIDDFYLLGGAQRIEIQTGYVNKSTDEFTPVADAAGKLRLDFQEGRL